MKCIIIFLSLIAYVMGDNGLTFDEWLAKHKISFSSPKERIHREKIFHHLKKEIEAHNSDHHKTFKKGLNKFSHLSGDEFIASKCGTKLPERLVGSVGSTNTKTGTLSLMSFANGVSSNTAIAADIPTIETGNHPLLSVPYPFGSYASTNAPTSSNYSNYLQPIVDQGSCGGCWAFATMAQLEGMLKIRNSSFDQFLSPQFLLDCDKTNKGCIGGWPTDALIWLKSITGGNNKCPISSAYQYKAVVGTCDTKLSTVSLGIAKIREYNLGGNEASMKAYVANYGPIIAAIHATPTFQSYSSGVFYDNTCASGSTCTTLNHAVLIVGYGTDASFGDYWLVKNSWGTGWGENGYVRMARNKDNNCNIACYAMFAY